MVRKQTSFFLIYVYILFYSQCRDGAWNCGEQPLSSRTCSVVGLGHVQTFDGATFYVKPSSYVLVKVSSSLLTLKFFKSVWLRWLFNVQSTHDYLLAKIRSIRSYARKKLLSCYCKTNCTLGQLFSSATGHEQKDNFKKSTADTQFSDLLNAILYIRMSKI